MSEHDPRTAPIHEVKAYLNQVRHRPVGRNKSPGAHSIVVPKASYSPWRDSTEFKEDHRIVAKNTLVDVYRCFELWSLVAQALKHPGDILEVGVWRGGTGVLMAQQAQRIAPLTKVYLCDTFAGVVKAGEKDNGYKGGEHADTSVEIVQDLIDLAGVNNVEILTGIFPDDGGDKLQDRRFALCHIDVDVYDSAKAVFDWVWPKLNVGGMVVFDDYGFLMCHGVTQLANEVAVGEDRVFFHNLNGHAVIVKLS